MDKIRQLNINMPKLDLRKMQRKSMEETLEPSPKMRLIGIAALLIACLSIGSITIYAYIQTKPVNNISELPIVQRDPSPLRTQPTQPGGLIISNQNKTIYQQLKKSASPIQQQVSDSNQAKVKQIVDKYFGATSVSIEAEKKTSENITPDKPAETTAPAASSNIFDLMPQTKPVDHGSKVKVRISVLKTHAEADQEWTRLSKKFKFLQSRKHRITEKIAKNGNKMFYLWVVNLEDAPAKEICNDLKKHNNACFVIYE